MTGSCAIHSVMTQTCISGRTENEIMIETLQYYAILVYTCLRQSAEYIYILYMYHYCQYCLSPIRRGRSRKDPQANQATRCDSNTSHRRARQVSLWCSLAWLGSCNSCCRQHPQHPAEKLDGPIPAMDGSYVEMSLRSPHLWRLLIWSHKVPMYIGIFLHKSFRKPNEESKSRIKMSKKGGSQGRTWNRMEMA